MIDLFYQGLTVTIFAYGVTSSGKTHTMQGSKLQPGVIPRTVQAIFRKKDHLCEATSSAQVSICMAYMEIYKDDVYDLLVTRENAPKLPVRENEHGKVFVANLTYEPLSTSTEFDALYARANKHRSVGATNLNRASSRSHAILLLRITITDPTSNRTLTGTINLVDLAGSENNKLTGNDPSRMAESAAINKSLSVLGQVVHALNSNQSRIPYRNSKLTRILQDALGGSSVGLLICNLAPGAKFRQDTLNTLNFASRTKNIENKPVVNEEENRPKPTFHAPPNPQRAGSHSRQSLLPAPKIPRASAVAHGGPGFQPLALQPQLGIKQEPSAVGLTLTESELNEKVAKAVEAEVARRMVEIGRQRQQEREEQEKKAQEALEAARQRPQSIAETEADVDKENRWHRRAKSRSPKKEPTHSVLPPGVLSPAKKPKELEGDLRSRLQELEQRFDRGSTKDAPDVLSPVSKKKIGRAYVAAARSHSEKYVSLVVAPLPSN
ncbi:hypothetical protein ONZ45_g18296 [Pleurotus djamor]|nr:hypothetical protein ONZ45_g18296 [Pleurotus djamor]